MNEDVVRLEKTARLSFSDGTVLSPLTNLVINLEELNTSLNGTPKRRISWTSVGSSSPCQPHQLSFKDVDDASDSPFTSVDAGCPDRIQNVLTSERRPRVFRKVLQSSASDTSLGFSPSVSHDKENSPRSSASFWPSPAKDVKSFEDVDNSSRDSGFSDKDEKSVFHFTEPKGLAPRRQLSSSGLSSGRSSSLNDVDSESFDPVEYIPDDGFQDSVPQLSADDSRGLPIGLCKLMEGDLQFGTITSNLSKPRSPLKQLDSRFGDNNAAQQEKTCSRGLFGVSNLEDSYFNQKFGFKRPDPPKDCQSPSRNKRRKSVSFCYKASNEVYTDWNKDMPKKVQFGRCQSATEATIMTAVQRSDQEPNLIGDFTKQYILPLVPGKHDDLKSISPDTVRELLVGGYDQVIEKCVIVDCRYPYEFEAGHIKGALNIYTKEKILLEFLHTPIMVVDTTKRLVVIFHCEFSSERGPNLSRFLRNKDREANKDCYPLLHYPEIYLLEGGYKDFFENHMSLCEPCNYKPMLHKDHEQDLKHFRAKSKSWGDDKGGRISSRAGLKF